MADVTIGLLNLLPGVPAVGTLAPGTTTGTDGLSFTALLSTQITQLGTAAAPTGDDLLDLETTTEDTAETAITNPLALLLGGVLLPTPLPPVQPTPTETTTATATTGALPSVTAQLPEVAVAPTRVDASRVESLRFEGTANPIAPATPNAVEASTDTPDVQPAPTPTATRTASQPVAPTPPQNTTPTTIEPTQVPPVSRVVVAQTPVVNDRTQSLPPPPVELRPVPVQPPVTEPEPIVGLPPVVAGQQPAIQQQRPTVVPQTVPTKPDAPFADVVKQAVATPTRPAPVAIPQAASPDVVPNLTAGSVIGSVRPTVAAFEQEWKPAVTADGTQAVDSTRVQPHTVPVHTNPTISPDRAVADTRPSLTPASQIGDTWITHAEVQSRGGDHEFRLRLDPPELGEVRVRVHSSADGVRAELTVASDAVRAMIESQIPELRQRLQDGGVSVSQFDVTTNTPGGDSSARNPYRETAPQDVRVESAMPAAKPGRTRDPTAAVGGLLDVTA